MTILTGSIQLSRDTESAWDYVDPILLAGTIAFSTDKFYGSTNSQKFKIGNGVDPWSSLHYHPDSDLGMRIGTTGIISASLQAVQDAGATATGIKLSNTTFQYSGNFRIAFSDTQYLQITSPIAGRSIIGVQGGVGQQLQFSMNGTVVGYIDQSAKIALSASIPGSNGSIIDGYDTNLTPATAGLALKSNNQYLSFYNTLAGATPKFIIGDGLVIGGVGTTSTLKLRATYGVGASGSDIIFQVGNNGATEAGRILYQGAWTGIRLRPRTLVQNAPGATPSTDTDALDFKHFTGLNAAITSMTTNLTGTPTEAQKLWLAFTDNGTPRAITWGASFENGPATLPTTTVISTRLDVGFIWNTVTSKWRCVVAG